MTTRFAMRTALVAAALTAAFGASAAAPHSKEAAAAKAHSATLTALPEAQYIANAEARCAPLPEGYKEACMARVKDGAGSKEGSVQGGGILFESKTTAPLGSKLDLPPKVAAEHAPMGKPAKAAKPMKHAVPHKPMAKKPLPKKAPAPAPMKGKPAPAPMQPAPAAK